jgi:hypothetical protein
MSASLYCQRKYFVFFFSREQREQPPRAGRLGQEMCAKMRRLSLRFAADGVTILALVHCVSMPCACSAPDDMQTPRDVPMDWVAAQREYFYMHKLAATDIGHNCQKMPDEYPEKPLEHITPQTQLELHSAWLRDTDAEPFINGCDNWCNSDIRSHLREIFTFTLFFSPRTIVELGVRSGWSTRAFAAAAKLIDARMVGIDLDLKCQDVYETLVGEKLGFAVQGDSAESAENYPLWVADRRDLGVYEHACVLMLLL